MALGQGQPYRCARRDRNRPLGDRGDPPMQPSTQARRRRGCGRWDGPFVSTTRRLLKSRYPDHTASGNPGSIPRDASFVCCPGANHLDVWGFRGTRHDPCPALKPCGRDLDPRHRRQADRIGHLIRLGPLRGSPGHIVPTPNKPGIAS